MFLLREISSLRKSCSVRPESDIHFAVSIRGLYDEKRHVVECREATDIYLSFSADDMDSEKPARYLPRRPAYTRKCICPASKNCIASQLTITYTPSKSL